MMGGKKECCGNCLHVKEKYRWEVVCGHPIMKAMYGRFKISERKNCPLWEEGQEE